MPRVIVCLIIVLLAGCGGTASDTKESACEAAFRQAAAIDPMQDTVSDLDAAVRDCTTEDEWAAASRAFPDALDGAPPGEFLRNRCAFDAALAKTTLCKSIAP
jgi:hypothetical protein